jgi:hypothetical protein
METKNNKTETTTTIPAKSDEKILKAEEINKIKQESEKKLKACEEGTEILKTDD